MLDENVPPFFYNCIKDKEPENCNCWDCTWKKLGVGQTGFALPEEGTGGAITELETVIAPPVPRGNAGCRADRICSAGRRCWRGNYGTGNSNCPSSAQRKC